MFQNVSVLEEAFDCVIVHNENTENERKEHFFKQMSEYRVATNLSTWMQNVHSSFQPHCSTVWRPIRKKVPCERIWWQLPVGSKSRTWNVCWKLCNDWSSPIFCLHGTHYHSDFKLERELYLQNSFNFIQIGVRTTALLRTTAIHKQRILDWIISIDSQADQWRRLQRCSRDNERMPR